VRPDRLRPLTRTALAAAGVLLLAACSGGAAPPPTDGPSPRVGGFEHARGVRVVAAGDIACEPGKDVTPTTCRDVDTARLVEQWHPAHVLALGDIQYDDGRLEDLETAYARSWGAFADITLPVPGNHDYHQPGAKGYLAYFHRQTGGRTYYARDLGTWRFYGLDSNCSDVDCDAEAAWLDEDMTAHPSACSVLTMHHPRYSSSVEHGDQDEVRPLWEVALRHHADLALAGHDHDYERFEPMDADGHRTPDGMTSFVVGTGGKSLYEEGDPDPGSVLFSARRAGVLDLVLGAGRFAWRFRDVDGRVVDSGVRRCRS
jgi:acid phosphatase type 7